MRALSLVAAAAADHIAYESCW